MDLLHCTKERFTSVSDTRQYNLGNQSNIASTTKLIVSNVFVYHDTFVWNELRIKETVSAVRFKRDVIKQYF